MYVYESPHEYYDMKSQGRDEHRTHLMIWFCCCPWQHLSFGGDIFEIREMMPGCPDAFCIFFFLVNQRRTAQLPGIIIDVGEQQWMSRIANYVYSGIEQRGGGASKSMLMLSALAPESRWFRYWALMYYWRTRMIHRNVNGTFALNKY